MTKTAQFIAMEGNIGAGKTTIACALAEHLGGKLILEEYQGNPFLEKFYSQPERYAFPAEMAFLTDRYKQLRENLPSTNDLFQSPIIADYAPFKSLIFAQNNLSVEEFQLYRQFWSATLGEVQKPGIVLFINRSIPYLLDKINQRGRSYERQIEESYLRNLHEQYLFYLRSQANATVIVINNESLDIKTKPDQVQWLVSLITKYSESGVFYESLTK